MITWTEIFIRLSLAAILGAAVGLERERRDRVAGMRTHMLVCLGSALVMIISMYGFLGMLSLDNPNVRIDPSRMAAQVISGIGFLGAGTIFFLKQKVVRGLTTAAGLWTVAAIGLAVGNGMYFAAAIATVFALIILWVVQLAEEKLFLKNKPHYMKIVVKDKEDSSEITEALLRNKSITTDAFSIEKGMDQEYTINLKIRDLTKNDIMRLVATLQKSYDIERVSWGEDF